MENNLIEIAYKKIVDLEKKLLIYLDEYKTKNELDFILCGGYIIDSELDEIINGTYTFEVSNEQY